MNRPIQSFVLRVEAEARFEGHGGARAITCIFFFLWKIKIRRHKIKKTNRVAFCSLDLEQERFTKTEPKLSKYLPH